MYDYKVNKISKLSPEVCVFSIESNSLTPPPPSSHHHKKKKKKKKKKAVAMQTLKKRVSHMNRSLMYIHRPIDLLRLQAKIFQFHCAGVSKL